jgi:MFS family permease
MRACARVRDRYDGAGGHLASCGRSEHGGKPTKAMTNLRETPAAATAAGSRVFYGWWIVASGFIINTANGGLVFHAFGAYVVLLEADFGWNRTAFALAFALQRVESGLLGPIEGWAIDRFGPRKVMMTGVVIFALGFFAFSQVNSILTFYLAFLLIALGSALGSFLPVTVAVVNWFHNRRALALAFVSMGFAAGGLVQPGVVALLESIGWRSMAVVSGLFVLAIGIPLASLVRHRPEDYGMRPDGAAFTEEDPLPEPGFTARQAIRTRAFWFIALGHSSSLLVIGAVMVHFVAHVNEGLGYSLGFAASMITVMTVSMVIGQTVIGGFLGDRINKRLTIVVALFGHTVALILLAFATNVAMILGFVIINGLAMGSRGPLIQAMRADYFGRQSFGTIMGFSALVMMGGMIIGPVVAGISYDTTGSYELGFTLLAVLAAMGSLFFVFATKPALPEPDTSPVGAPAAVPPSPRPAEAARAGLSGDADGAADAEASPVGVGRAPSDER